MDLATDPLVEVDIDADGVMLDFTSAALRRVKALFGLDFDASHITQWNLELCLGLSPAQVAQLTASWGEPGFCADVLPYPGAVNGVAQLRRFADVYALTQPFVVEDAEQHPWHGERHRILAGHLGFREDRIIQAHGQAKHKVHGDVLIEDKPSTLARCLERWPDKLGIAAVHPYNSDEFRDLDRRLRGATTRDGMPRLVTITHAANDADGATRFWDNVANVVHAINVRRAGR